jgi:hypothetical protein
MSIQYSDKNAEVLGTVAETFNIGASNKNLQFTIDGGSAQNIVLTEGSARTAAQVAADINAVLTGGTAYAVQNGAQAGKVRIRTTSANAASSTILVGSPSNNANATLGFAAGTYTGFGPRHTLWTQSAGTKQELINKLETELLAAGWTTVSGSGTGNLLMQSALSPPGQDLQMRVRFKDNSGNCVTGSIENVAGSLASGNSTTQGFHLLPAASKQWIFTHNKYQVFVRTPVVTAAREHISFGIPYLKESLRGYVYEAIWALGNAISDTDTTVRTTFRTRLTSAGGASNRGAWASITNGNMWQSYADATSPGRGVLRPMTSHPGTDTPAAYSWFDDSADIYTPEIAWALTAVSGTAKYAGQLWDAFVTTESFTGDVTTTLDGHNWIALTASNTGAAGFARGTLFLVTS